MNGWVLAVLGGLAVLIIGARAASGAVMDTGTGPGLLGMGDHTRRMAHAIVSVFESGTPVGRYAAVAILADGAGISYGVHQGTDASGTLDAIVERYIALGGRLSAELAQYRERLAANATTRIDRANPPAWVRELVSLLERAAAEPVMRQAQDETFEQLYWRPALEQARALELREPLSIAVVYDTFIHSGPRGLAWIRNRFPELPPSRGGDERAWTRAYVRARRQWLATHATPAVRATVYRMDAFQGWMDAGLWSLPTPLTVPRPRATIR